MINHLFRDEDLNEHEDNILEYLLNVVPFDEVISLHRNRFSNWVPYVNDDLLRTWATLHRERELLTKSAYDLK